MWGIGELLNPIEVILPPTASVRTRLGLHVRRRILQVEDIGLKRGLRLMSLPRTLCDLSARMPLVDALIACDIAVRAKLQHAFDLSGRWPGAARLRRLAALAEPAESPMETRLRWLLLEAGLPRPEVQTDLHDADGRFIGRADLFYPEPRVVVEYDGANHRDRLTEDNRRQNLLINGGFTVLRFSAADLTRPELVASQVRRALTQRPA